MTEVIKVEDCGENIGDYDVSIYKAILIPKNATNGNVIKAMFPSMIIQERNNVTLDIRGKTVEFTGMALREWWNTPYNTESEETDADSN